MKIFIISINLVSLPIFHDSLNLKYIRAALWSCETLHWNACIQKP